MSGDLPDFAAQARQDAGFFNNCLTGGEK